MFDELPGTRRSVPISALEHFAYCPRQAALIHVEAYFDASVDTVRGDAAHQAVDRGGTGRDQGRRIVRSLPIWSDALGLHGLCDVVEFDADGAPVPVEHKSGGYRPGGPADVQVTAQVLCLREMFDRPVPVGIVFSGKDRRRHEVAVDARLCRRVAETAAGMRELLDDGRLPAPVNDNRCRRCSLRAGCMPDTPQETGGLFTPRPLGEWDG